MSLGHHALVFHLCLSCFLLHAVHGVQPVSSRRCGSGLCLVGGLCRYRHRCLGGIALNVHWNLDRNFNDFLDDNFHRNFDDLFNFLGGVHLDCDLFGGVAWLAVRRWFAVVCTIERDLEWSLLECARIDRKSVTFPQHGEVHIKATCHKLSECSVEAINAVLALAVCGDCEDIIVLECTSDKVCQDSLGANLDEGSDARVVHVFKLLNEAHRLGDLIGERAADLFSVTTVRCSVGVGVNRHLGGAKLKSIKEGLEWTAGLTDKR